MEKIEACNTCKYATDKFCYGIDCKDCKLNDTELNVCKCYIIAPHQECPYYEPIEEEVDNGKESIDMPEM